MTQPQPPAQTVATAPPPGPKTLLMGGIGTGKTHSLRSYLDLNPAMKLFVILTEPSGPDVLLDVPDDRCHWAYIPAMAPDWSVMKQAAEKVNELSLKSLADLSDPGKRQYRELIDVLGVLADFRCDRCGRSFGMVDKFPLNWVLAIDSLSGLNVMAMNLVAGFKPVKSQSDWGIAMGQIQTLVTRLTALDCPVVLTAHVEREFDEVTGQSMGMPSTLGKKLAPVLPRFFSDVVMTRREGTNFLWSTTTSGVDLKARNLPWSDKITPSFAELFRAWQKRGGFAFPSAMSQP